MAMTEPVKADAAPPSGAWRGYFIDPRTGAGRRHRMDLDIRFQDGRLDGAGRDGVGRFQVRGVYRADGEARWTKHYFGAHDVSYRGFWENGVLWGIWNLEGAVSGGFKLWPAGRGDGESLRVEEEAPIEEPATPAPAAPRALPEELALPPARRNRPFSR